MTAAENNNNDNKGDSSFVRQTGASGGYTTFTNSERKTFVRYVNDCMADASSSAADWVPISLDPLDPENEFLSRFQDGKVLCALLNRAVEGSIDQKAVHKGPNLSKFQMIENLNLALKAAREIGCVVVNIGHEDIFEEKPHAILGLLWQILRIDLLNNVSLLENVQVIALKEEAETLQDFMKLDDRDVLLRWINYQLQKDGRGEPGEDMKKVENFGSDLKDSTVYVRILRTVAPHLISEEEAQEVLQEEDLMKRAERVIALSERLNMERKIYIDPQDIVQGSTRINTAFVAAIFEANKDSSLATPETEDPQKMLELRTQILDIVVAELAKDLPSVRSSKFTAFIQAAKNLTQVTRSSFEDSSVLDKLRKSQESVVELQKQLEDSEKRSVQQQQELESRAEQLEQNLSDKEAEIAELKKAHEQQLADERERLAKVESTLQETEEQLKSNEQRFQDTIQETQATYDAQLAEERIRSADLETQLQQLRDEMQKQREDFENQIAALRKEMQEAAEAHAKELSEEKLKFTNLESEYHDLQQTSEQQQQEIEKLKESRSMAAEKSKDLVQRLLRLKDILKQTRMDLDYGMSMAGQEAETKLALHRFGDLSATVLQTKFKPSRVGQMYKRGNKVKTWKKRYHILVQNYLFYFATVKDSTPKGFLRVDDCKVEALPDAAKPHCFRILVKSRELVCHCESQSEMDSWIFAIREAGDLDTVTSSQ